MVAISKIKIDGFKAFPKEFELILEGKNLLMYGENGSGKSSIYYTLHALLQSQYHDKGSIYFDKNNSESLVNKYTTTVDPENGASPPTLNGLIHPVLPLNWP